MRIPFEAVILHQDEHLIVVDKPHFLPVTPSGRYLQETVLVRLKRKLNLPNLVPIHRIDRDTAGLVLLSVQPSSYFFFMLLLLMSCSALRVRMHECEPWNIDDNPLADKWQKAYALWTLSLFAQLQSAPRPHYMSNSCSGLKSSTSGPATTQESPSADLSLASNFPA